MRIGSLCSGYGGLEMGARAVLGGEVAWFSEIDPAASAVLAARWPAVPNVGDLRAAELGPVDVLCAGFPCQPFSLAGHRAGTSDERWLFDDICTAVGRMDPRPRLLVFENVPGLLTADGGHAMARVVHGLARLGYLGSWRTLAAADIGAPHRRERVFIVAADADGDEPERIGRPREMVDAASARQGREEEREWVRDAVGNSGPLAADASGDRRERRPQLDGPEAPGLNGPSGRHAHRRRLESERRPRVGEDDPVTNARRPRRQGPRPAETRLPEPAADDVQPLADLDRFRLDRSRVYEPRERRGPQSTDGGYLGPYRPAIERWEQVTGRAAPLPIDDRGRLNPPFVEWMMGLPAGHVTAVAIPRTAQLRVLGNGVVPQQAAAALALLLEQQAAAA